MSEIVKWDGFPVFGRDRNAWHLLQFENDEHPVPMWWDWHLEAWFLKPEASAGMRAEVCPEEGYSYCAGTVTPSDLKEAISEAVAAERERCAKVCEAHSNGALCSAMIGGPDAQGLQNISRAHQRAAQSIRSAAK